MKKIIILCALITGLLFNAKAQQVNKYEVELTEMNEKLALNLSPEQKAKYMEIVNARSASWKSLSMEAKAKGEDLSSPDYKDKVKECNTKADKSLKLIFNREQRVKYDAYIIEKYAPANKN
jgi:hypothetical protein